MNNSLMGPLKGHLPWFCLLFVTTWIILTMPACAVASNKWTVFIYMLADNDLEQYALLDMEEIMAGMAAEPVGCTDTPCGGTCPSDKIATFSKTCSEGTIIRCCPESSYPDVMLLVDRGNGQRSTFLQGNHPEDSLLTKEWTTAKQLLALPGGELSLLKDWSEIDMSKADVLASFLADGLARYEPSPSRRYMLTFWDHGSGWSGYGVDHTCSSTAKYNANRGCDILSMQEIIQGLAAGLKDKSGLPVKLDIIGFDACLMAMYEVGALLSPYSHHLLASELLEPGHGWDYAPPLRGLIQQRTPAGELVTSMEAEHVGELIIEGYMQQAAALATSGLTLALLDLDVLSTDLQTAINSMAQYMANQLHNSPGYSMGVMRKRALLSEIDGAKENVDLGAMLTGFKAMAGQTSLAAMVQQAATAYQSVVKVFRGDGELPDGTGMAIYFPSNSYVLDKLYSSLVSLDTDALSSWLTFLHQLHTATDLYTQDAKLGQLRFEEKFAINYLATSTNTWVTHGTLSNYLGLTASLMYGFKTPDGSEFMTAGNTEANIEDKRAVGTWSGYLFGLVQDLTPGDNAVDGLALAYADESRLVDTSGSVRQLILQIKVYYAPSCYAPINDMKKGILKYVYDTTSKTTAAQLFVSSSGGSWGEIPSAQGGVIIPYLGAYNLSLNATVGDKLRVSFGYSDCLKWGYSDRIQLAAFSAVQAAGVLGLDLARDMETRILVNAVDGVAVTIPGYFRPAQKTRAGCQCAQRWVYQKTASAAPVWLSGTCINPLNDPKGAWCVFEPDSCTTPEAVANKSHSWDYCSPTITLSGCQCHPHWTLNDKHYYGGTLDDGDARGPWCVVDRATCPGSSRAHQYGAGSLMSATVNGAPATLTGLDFDYTKQITMNGCRCRNPWTYNGTTHYGTCHKGIKGSGTLPGYSAGVSWCYVDEGCKGAGDWEGYPFDVCGPDGGRTTVSGEACKLPTTYDGVPMYDCLPFKYDTGTTTAPWCFTSDGRTGTCAPWTCSGPVKQQCPATDPSVPGADISGWAAKECLEALCSARQALANITQCTSDSDADKELLQQRFHSLNASSSFGALLRTNGWEGSLASYCDAQFGQICVDLVVDPACPALFRNNNKWWLNNEQNKVCSMECLKTLCMLQERAATQVQGTPQWQAAVAEARSFSTPALTCADASLESLVRWTLMQSMDKVCGWPGPVNLACNKLLSVPQLCAESTELSEAAGNITDGVPAGARYSASSSCSWTINTPEKPYVSLNFSRFATERLYDLVTVEDFDGLIGMFSGTDLPPAVSTDTGLIRLQFVSDGTLQAQGFAASYVASASPQLQLPTCSSSTKLVQVVLRSRQYGAELSWLISRRAATTSLSTPSQSNIVMAGGLLPVNLQKKLPKSVSAAADAEYKDYRSYYSYACLSLGNYNLNMYDSYGDGWDGGRITITQMLDATSGCQLVTDTLNKSSNKTVAFSITVDADTNNEACSSLVTKDTSPYYAEAGIVISSEDRVGFHLAKQRKIKEALALLLNVDLEAVSILGISDSQPDELEKVEWGAKESSMASTVVNNAKTSDVNSSALNIQQVYRRSLLASEAEQQWQQDNLAHLEREGTTIHGMLMQQAAKGLRPASHGNDHVRKALYKLATPVENLISAGAFDQKHRQLLQSGDSTNAPAGSESPATTASLAAGTSNQQHVVTLDENGQWQSVILQGPDAATHQLDSQPTDDDEGLFSAAEQVDVAPGQLLGAASNEFNSSLDSIANSSDITTSSSSGDSAFVQDMSSVLAAQPVTRPDLTSGQVETQVLNSNLQQLLQPLKPIAGPAVKQTNRGPKPKTVVLSTSFRAAFAGPVVAAAGSNSGGSFAGGFPSLNPVINSNQPISSTGTEEVVSSLFYDGPLLPAEPATMEGQTSSDTDGSGQVSIFDAIPPSRSLLQDVSVDRVGSNQPVSLDATTLANFVKGGRVGHYGTPRPRPKPVIPDTVEQQQEASMATGPLKEFVNFTNETHAVNESRPLSGTSLKLDASHDNAKQSRLKLMGPKKPLPKRMSQSVDATAVKAFQRHTDSWHTGGTQNSSSKVAGSSGRNLLATNDSSGVLIITRISGYQNSELAQAAAENLQQLVINGSLSATLARQGWSGVTLGVLFTRTGVRPGYTDGYDLKLIAGVAAAGGVVFFGVVIILVWYIKKKRQQGTALPPITEGIQHPGSRMLVQQTAKPAGTSGSSGSVSRVPMQGIPAAGYPTAAPRQTPAGGSFTTAMAVSSAPAGAHAGSFYGSPRSNTSSPVPRVIDTAAVPNNSATANPFSSMGAVLGPAQHQQHMHVMSPRTQPSVGGTGLAHGVSTAQQYQVTQLHPFDDPYSRGGLLPASAGSTEYGMALQQQQQGHQWQQQRGPGAYGSSSSAML